MSRRDDLEREQQPAAKTVEELQKDEALKRVNDLKKTISENEKLLKSYEDKAVEREKRISSLEEELKIQKNNCSNLRSKIDDLDLFEKKMKKDHQAEVSELKEETKKLKAELDKAKKEVKAVPLKVQPIEPLDDDTVEELMRENEELIEKKLKAFFSKFVAEFNTDITETKTEIEKELKASLEAAKKERAAKKAAKEKEQRHKERMCKLREEKAFLDSLIEEEEGKK